MATPVLLTTRDFTTSRYAQVAENTAGNLSDILARAEQAIQSRLGRNLLDQPYVEVFRATSQTLFVKNRPITTLTSIRRRPSIWSAWADVPLSRIMTFPSEGYFEVYESVQGFDVEVSYSAGWTVATLPENVKEAIIMQAVLLSYQDLEVYGVGDAKEPGINYFHRDIDRLLEFHKATGTVWH